MPGGSARQVFQPALLPKAGVGALLQSDGLFVVVAQRLKAVPAKPHHVAYELSHQQSSPPRFEGATCSHDSRPAAQGGVQSRSRLNFRGLRGLRRANPGDTAADRCSIWASRNALAISVMRSAFIGSPPQISSASRTSSSKG